MPVEKGQLAIVGEQPWITEARMGRPFVGRSGKLLRALAQRHGLTIDTCLVTNAIGCYAGQWPSSDATKKKTMRLAAECCRGRLMAELEEARPSAIFALGRTAFDSLIENWAATVKDFRGSLNWFGGIPLTTSFHPSAVLRGDGQNADILSADLGKAARWAKEGPETWFDAWELAPRPERLSTLMTGWAQRGMIACDLETFGVNRWTCDVRMLGLGDWSMAVIIPWGDMANLYYSRAEQEDVVELLRWWFSHPDLGVVMHNKSFDHPILERMGFELRGRVECTMTAHHSLYSKGVLHGLDDVGQQYFDVPPWKMIHGTDHTNSDFKEEALYCSRDVRITDRLWFTLRDQLVSDGLWGAYEQDQASADLAWRYSRAGIPVDTVALHAAQKDYQEQAFSFYSEAYRLAEVDENQQAMFRLLDGLAPEWEQLRMGSLTNQEMPSVEVLLSLIESACDLVYLRDDQKKLEESKGRLYPLCNDLVSDFELVKADQFDDSELGQEKRKEVRARVARGLAICRSSASRLRAAAGRLPFCNLASDQQAGVIIHDHFDLPVIASPNADGSYATDKAALIHVRGHPFVHAFQEWKSSEKDSVWLATLPVYPDGFVHPLYKAHGTPSARWSCGDSKSDDLLLHLNAQNIRPHLLYLFTTDQLVGFLGHPKWVFIGADFSALELRVAAALSGCRNLLAQFRAYDAGQAPKLHEQTARELWPGFDSLDEQEREKRYGQAKNSNFSVVYGGTWRVIYSKLRGMTTPVDDPDEQLEVDRGLELTAQEIHKALSWRWPEIFAIGGEWFNFALGHGWLRSGYLTGRIMRFPLADREHIRPTLCANVPVQCTAREIVVRSASRIHHRLPRPARLCIDTHDCLVVMAPQPMAEEVAGIMKEEMQYELAGPAGPIRIYATPKIGTCWKEVK